ncbi:MAG: bifunctional phosphopantothenoylcysteine decarboxylase/phosphopantothenate--cysteine ligase CoaBC [Christensenellales bacterium]|jgi:phosphopantothenoylcysteine decarboxylase/phosphopantothenate--cysteine ligase|nr:bifunctional phosphopantothenoylcysteine decarboxylase/phosphopantothenate--cysteine ligase CoaBC [Clostridiales bacterium]
MKKTVVLGVTGCIAAYKACEIVSSLKKLNYDVRVIMTQNATEFVSPLTFETLSNNKVVVSTFEKNREFNVEHISYAKLADIFVVAPATANVISKIADGIADDMLTTTIMATKALKIICPAMNTAMYENPLFQQNLKKLKDLGYLIIEPESGPLACGDIGKGRLADPQDIVAEIDKRLTPNPDYRGKTILITAGATEEAIDSVRFITNHSSGKMGISIAKAALARGAKVILIHGRVSEMLPDLSSNIYVKSTEDMYKEVIKNLDKCDIVIKAAAPSDYKVKNFSKEKIKATNINIELEKNIDIAAEVGKRKDNKKLIIFAAETSDLLKHAKNKLNSKNADLVVANDVLAEGAGFNVDTNIVTLIKPNGDIISLEKMLKTKLADVLLDNILLLD